MIATILYNALLALAGLWIVVGGGLTFIAMRELYSPERQAARLAWRRATLDRASADANTDFYHTRASFVLTFLVVMALWPFLLHHTVTHKGVQHR